MTAFQDSLTGGKEEKDMLMEEITQKKIVLSSIGQNVYSMEEKLLRLQEEQKALRTEQKKAEPLLHFLILLNRTDIHIPQCADFPFPFLHGKLLLLLWQSYLCKHLYMSQRPN